jgi:metallo-beta-lactamase superfamily protein
MLTTVGIGGIELVSLLDGAEDLDDPDILDPLHGPSDDVWDPYRRLYPAVFAADGGWRPHVRGTLLRAHGRTILVDTGVGGPTSPAMSWYPAPGRLMGSLAESGTSPGDVDVVVITHVHDDHIGGTVTAQGDPAFPNARYLVNRIDLDRQEELAGQTDDDRAVWELLLAPLKSRGVLQAIDDAYEVAPIPRIAAADDGRCGRPCRRPCGRACCRGARAAGRGSSPRPRAVDKNRPKVGNAL